MLRVVPREDFEHVQLVAATPWIINHNLGFRPNVELRNSGNEVIDGEIVHTSVNQTVCYFNFATAGSARCT